MELADPIPIYIKEGGDEKNNSKKKEKDEVGKGFQAGREVEEDGEGNSLIPAKGHKITGGKRDGPDNQAGPPERREKELTASDDEKESGNCDEDINL